MFLDLCIHFKNAHIYNVLFFLQCIRLDNSLYWLYNSILTACDYSVQRLFKNRCIIKTTCPEACQPCPWHRNSHSQSVSDRLVLCMFFLLNHWHQFVVICIMFCNLLPFLLVQDVGSTTLMTPAAPLPPHTAHETFSNLNCSCSHGPEKRPVLCLQLK